QPTSGRCTIGPCQGGRPPVPWTPWGRKHRRSVSVVIRLLSRLWPVLVLCGVLSAAPLQAQVVVSQVYGGGGNSGAPYSNDFIELFNRGSDPVPLSGLSLQYASATGTGNFGAGSSQLVVLPAVTLEPGRYFLVGLA